ncbi:MAG TPA: hypothetical protein VLE49_20910 [Anaerolineales bacterium]|nr:hypothetical protein [Anaerolineales bacterium]
MIDPTQLPILLKAIDFVFEEGRKILQERRERRKAQEMQENPPQAEIQQPVQDVAIVEVKEKEQTKQELLAAKIDEIRWQNHEMEVQHLVRLLETYSRNYQLAKEQYAKWGSALVPPIVVNNLNEAENSVFETIKQLEAVLSKVYEKDIHPAT